MSTTQIQSRSISIDDVTHALQYIREHVITEENISSFFDIVKKISQSYIEIYQQLSYATDHQDSIETYAKARGLSVEEIHVFLENHDRVKQVKNTLYNIQPHDEKRSRSLSVSLEGLLDAFEFIVTHVRTAGDILEDIQKLFQAVATVENFKEQEKNTSSRAMFHISPEEERVYQSFAQADTRITAYV